MKAVFLSLPLRGHVNPSLAVVRELTARGEEILYYSTAPFRGDVERTGAHYRSYSDQVGAELKPLAVPATDKLSWLLMRVAGSVLRHDLARIRADAPDYVITDSVAPWGQWIGEILGVPVVTSITTFAVNRKVLGYAVRHGVKPTSAGAALSKIRHITKAAILNRRLRREFAARGPGVTGTVMGRSALNIVFTSTYFQPCAETFDARYHFVGPAITREETTAFDWSAITHPVVVYVSLGTLFNANIAFYQSCFAAFAGEDVQVIMSIGDSVGEPELGTVPPNVVVRRRVPQLEVLRRAGAFVTHAGMNSVGEALSFSVPLVLVPQMGEQEVIARRVEELGAGVVVPKNEAGADSIRSSVRRVLAGARFRRQASAIGDSFAQAGGARRAVDAILAFTRGRRVTSGLP